MRKIITMIVWACLLPTWAYAQDEDIKKCINNIKGDTTYIYGEATLLNKDEAFEMAKDQLHINIELWVKSILPDQEINSVSAKKIDNYYQQLSLMRGDRYRAFVYVKKDDIYALLPINRAAKVTDNREQAETPLTGITSNVLESFNSQINCNEQKHVASSQSPNLDFGLSLTDKDLLSELFRAPTLFEAKKLLNSEKYRSQYYYGNVRSAKDGRFIKENKAVLIIFSSRDKSICAIVMPEDSGHSIVNLKTGNEDSLANYPDCEAIWIVKSN